MVMSMVIDYSVSILIAFTLSIQLRLLEMRDLLGEMFRNVLFELSKTPLSGSRQIVESLKFSVFVDYWISFFVLKGGSLL